MTRTQSNTEKWIRIMGAVCAVLLLIGCGRMAVPLASISRGQIEVDFMAEENAADTTRIILNELYSVNAADSSSVPTVRLPSQICVIGNSDNTYSKAVLCVKCIALCHAAPPFACLLLAAVICVMVAAGRTFSRANYRCLLAVSLIFLLGAVLLPVLVFLIIPAAAPGPGGISASYNIEATFKFLLYGSAAFLGALIVKSRVKEQPLKKRL